MYTLHYTEKTRMPQWVFILLAIQTVTVCFLVWQTAEASGMLFVLAVTVPVALLLYTAGVQLRFTPDALTYKGTPFPLKPRELKWDDIREISIIKIDPLTDFWGWGYKKSVKYGWGHIYDSSDALFIIGKDGKKITLSLKDKEQAADFLRRHNILPFSTT